MAIRCPKAVRGLRMRVTAQDECHEVLSEATASARTVIKAFVGVDAAPNLAPGNEILTRNAAGDIEVYDPPRDRLKALNLTINLAGIQFVVAEMMLDVLPLLGGGTDTIGGVLPDTLGDFSDQTSVQLEVWSSDTSEDACSGASALPYLKFVFPKVVNAQLNGNLVMADNGQPVNLSLRAVALSNPAFVPSVASEWDAADITQVKAGGPMAWIGTDALPTPTPCDYVAAA